jgi:hypothetical protein
MNRSVEGVCWMDVINADVLGALCSVHLGWGVEDMVGQVGEGWQGLG